MRSQLRPEFEDKSQQEREVEAGLERFLADVTQPVASLGETAQSEWRTEAEQHICERARAYEELGVDAETAFLTAVRDFGNATQVGKSVAKESVLWWQNSFLAAFARGSAGALLAVPAAFGVYVALGSLLRFLYLTDNPNTIEHSFSGVWMIEVPWAVPIGAFVWARQMTSKRAAHFGAWASLIFVVSVLFSAWLGSMSVPVTPKFALWDAWVLKVCLVFVAQGALTNVLLAESWKTVEKITKRFGKMPRKRQEPSAIVR